MTRYSFINVVTFSILNHLSSTKIEWKKLKEERLQMFHYANEVSELLLVMRRDSIQYKFATMKLSKFLSVKSVHYHWVVDFIAIYLSKVTSYLENKNFNFRSATKQEVTEAVESYFEER